MSLPNSHSSAVFNSNRFLLELYSYTVKFKCEGPSEDPAQLVQKPSINATFTPRDARDAH